MDWPTEQRRQTKRKRSSNTKREKRGATAARKFAHDIVVVIVA